MVFKYMAPGNLKEVAMVVELMKERVNSGKLAVLSEQPVQAAQVVAESKEEVKASSGQEAGLPSDVTVVVPA